MMVMTARRPCPPAPGPLEAYAPVFDDLFGNVAQRRGFRAYLQGLLLPHDHRNDVGSPRARWCACLTDDDWRRQLADVTGAVARLDHGGVQW